MEQQTVAALLTILNSKEITFDQLLEADQSEKVVPPSPAARIVAEMKTRSVKLSSSFRVYDAFNCSCKSLFIV